jgi:transcriptional regulator GlxA family with amidase domain
MDNAGNASTDGLALSTQPDATKELIMNKLTVLVYPLVALMSLAAAVAAHAESPTVDNSASQVWNQTKTRAQVQAELVAARADGSIKAWSTSYNPLAMNLNVQPTKTRAQMHATAMADRAANYSATWFGEDSGSFELARAKPAREAGPVLAGMPKSAQ